MRVLPLRLPVDELLLRPLDEVERLAPVDRERELEPVERARLLLERAR